MPKKGAIKCPVCGKRTFGSIMSEGTEEEGDERTWYRCSSCGLENSYRKGQQPNYEKIEAGADAISKLCRAAREGTATKADDETKQLVAQIESKLEELKVRHPELGVVAFEIGALTKKLAQK